MRVFADCLEPLLPQHDAGALGQPQNRALKNVQIIAVHDDQIRIQNGRSDLSDLRSDCFSLAAFLGGAPPPEGPAAGSGPRGFPLLIVPDHWFGQLDFAFQSRKPSVVASFAKRQLQAAHPELPLIEAFYAFRFTRGAREPQRLSIAYLQEPRGYQLYERLEDCGLVPHLITTPALLWEHKLQSRLADFADGGRCLIQVVGPCCFLYFFFGGWFLFSRSITLPDLSLAPEERFGALVYELNQSFYLFAQKAKADVAAIYLVSPRAEDPARLTGLLGREVKPLVLGAAQGEPVLAPQGSDSPVAAFIAEAFCLQNGFRGIAHRRLKRELDWKPVQIAAAVVGVVTLLTIAAESFFLWGGNNAGASAVYDASAAEALAGFNDALAFISAEAGKPSPAETVAAVMRSLPAGTRIKTLALAIAERPGLRLEGVMAAPGPEAFETRLASLLDRLNQGFGISPPLGLQDVVCHPEGHGSDAVTAAGGQGVYAFALEFGLP
jgi:hypothetical protein